MKLTQRQHLIIELLLSRIEGLTAKAVASEVNVSTRTVYRELDYLEAVLNPLGASIQKITGTGISLQASPEQIQLIKDELSRMVQVEYSAEDRKVMLFCLLLEADEPVKLFALAHELNVTMPTVSYDLNDLAPLVSQMGLNVIRKKGFGVQLEGSEARKREAIWYLVKNHLDESVLFAGAASEPLSPVAQTILEMVGKENLMKVEQVLWQLEGKLPLALSEQVYTDLLIRLSIAVTRMRAGRRAEADQPAGNRNLQEAAGAIVRLLSEVLELTIRAEEAVYVADLLENAANLITNPLLQPHNHDRLVEIVLELIRDMEQQMNIPFSRDRQLREGLTQDMEQVLQRIEGGVRTRNPELSQIKRNFPDLYERVRRAMERQLTGRVVFEEEIGFLVMHFCASVERMKQFSRTVKAVIVCTNGIGSANMLATRLQTEFPQIEVIGRASWYEAVRIPKDAYDLIISTVELPLPARQYIKLSSLLTTEEAEALRTFIREGVLSRSPAQAALPDPSLDRLYTMKGYLNEAVALIHQFEVYRLPPVSPALDLEGTLRQMCRKVVASGRETGLRKSHIESIVLQLLERERQSTQIIPDSALALFHTRSRPVQKPILQLFRLSAPLTLNPENLCEVRQLLLMLSPCKPKKEMLEVFSDFSAMLLQPELIQVLENGSLEEIKQFLSKHLLESAAEKAELGRYMP